MALIAATGGGNLGDQAMLETFLDETAGLERSIFVQSRSAVDVTSAFGRSGADDLVAMPGLTHGFGLRHFTSLYRFGRLLSSFATLFVVGADVMDGAYSDKASRTRWLIAKVAADRGVKVAVLGFSWNGKPTRGAREAMRRASKSNVTMYARDPLSATRLREDGSTSVVEAADTVFLYSRRDEDSREAQLVAQARRAGKRIALVNASGLVASSTSQVGAYASAIQLLQRLNYAVFMVPHVDRAPRSDTSAIAAIMTSIPDSAKPTVIEMTNPSIVRTMALGADLVITGRMHLAVIALSCGVPAAVIATQGKVMGLLELFSLTDLCLEPGATLEQEMLSRIHLINDRIGGVRNEIQRALPHVKQLAERNFELLGKAK
ncbi:polysaccharide pyruvyl transferase family protein [Marisediminicola senii]|uniref:polysaccharide pyruvyl transferase family protein n=1 Tax=Marisediminicola senii TaxID=2711233 RepID=UPI0013EDD092|nr:polysaccharide pyruvyl transferase family protein [Marisediminicola senii]